ncbi:T-cell-interacting, activating receptor on myeloid cells protein 1-like isoform X2 [Malaclemys terrapin pileata]|uniref:T-cell-interacting, activating receptor on myeloid cells protein 1-like isoform X2 n=1 Tax=Malaclemys terrapin pileata TaxID=2991368 RepID=UPI0023A90C84|nr:T-cell-interacting, activating receptor on myeloid cells protein 1-like isoform X2 [Malaclemys terrapin pileata]
MLRGPHCPVMASALTALLLEPSYPKPNISLSPSGGVSLGRAVDVRCRGEHQGVRFMLKKEGRHFRPVDSNGFEVVFCISNVRREELQLLLSQQIGAVHRVVPQRPRGAGGERSELTQTLHLSEPHCQGQHQNVTFFLHKAGDLNPQQQMDPAGDRAEFRIPTVGRQHGGSYSCSYRPQSEPFVSSEPSDPVQLVVAGGWILLCREENLPRDEPLSHEVLRPRHKPPCPQTPLPQRILPPHSSSPDNSSPGLNL